MRSSAHTGETGSWSLSIDDFDRLFPFHFVFSGEGTLEGLGSTLRRVCPGLERAERVEQAFLLMRPAIPFAPTSVAQHLDACFVFKVQGCDLVLRGQIVCSGTHYLYMGFPRVDGPEYLKRMGLTLGDFPHHSSITDYLLVQQSQALALVDAQRIASRLSEKSAAYAALLQSIPDLIIHLDREGRIANLTGANTQLPQHAEGLLGAKLDAVFDSSEVAVLEEARTAALSGTHRIADYQSLRAAVLRDFEVRASSSGNQEVLLMIRDVTERKETERDLVNAREAALTASRAKSSFLATISHELRTPMNAVIGMAELLSDTLLTAEQRQYVTALTRSGENLLSLIDDLLDLSKIEGGRLDIEALAYSLHDLLEELRILLAPRARAKSIEFRFRAGPAVPPQLIGDPKRVRQIVTNLVGNALKFTHRGQVVLRCDVTDRQPPMVRLEISDTGIGMTPQVRERLFEPFTQGDASTSRLYGGTGLGLHICRRLVELMNGAIGVETEAGKGSTFWVELPLLTPSVERAASEGANFTPVEDRLGGKVVTCRPWSRALVVDDQPVNRLVARRLLEKRGFSVAEADCGQNAVEAQARDRFDVIFMDVQMPNMDGFEATLAIRAAGSRVPIVALTANALPQDRARCLERGMDAYLSKPLRGADLDRLLARPRISSYSGSWAAVRIPREVATAITSAPPPLFEPGLTSELTDGDRELAREFLGMALAGLAGRFDELKNATHDPAQPTQVGFHAHALKAIVSGLTRGAPVDLLQRLEVAAANPVQRSACPALVSELEPLLKQLGREIEAFCAAL